MAIKMEGEGSTSTGVMPWQLADQDKVAIPEPTIPDVTEPYVAPITTAPIATPTKLPTVVKVPGSGEDVATVTKPVVLEGEPAPVYEPTMSPSETAQQNWENAPVAQPEPDVVPENVVVNAGLAAPSKTGTATKTTTGGTAGVTVPTVPSTETQPWKEYMDKAMNTSFEYNPATDNEYKLASAQIEQQVTDMMVGRGGLYSSVAQSALTNKLMELQVAYQKQAYEKYLTERDYNMKVASFLAERSDTEFEQNLAVQKFNADLEQQKFNNSIATANLRIAQANAAYNRQVAEAKTQQANAQTALNMQTAEYMAASKEFEYMQNKWREDGVADYEIASYFNVPVGADVSSQYGNRITQAIYNLDSKAQAIAQQAKAIGDAETYLNALTGFQSENTTDSKVIEQKYASAYAQEYNDIIAQHQAGASYSDLLNYVTANYTQYVNAIGTSNYNRLINYLDDKVASGR